MIKKNEYHQRNIRYFKSKLEDALNHHNSRFPHKTLKFNYNKQSQKFGIVDVPFDCLTTFNRVVELEPVIGNWID